MIAKVKILAIEQRICRQNEFLRVIIYIYIRPTKPSQISNLSARIPCWCFPLAGSLGEPSAFLQRGAHKTYDSFMVKKKNDPSVHKKNESLLGLGTHDV